MGTMITQGLSESASFEPLGAFFELSYGDDRPWPFGVKLARQIRRADPRRRAAAVHQFLIFFGNFSSESLTNTN